MQKLSHAYGPRYGEVILTELRVHVRMRTCAYSMDLLLSATGQEDLFLVGNNASRRLPFPTGDLVWGAP